MESLKEALRPSGSVDHNSTNYGSINNAGRGIRGSSSGIVSSATDQSEVELQQSSNMEITSSSSSHWWDKSAKQDSKAHNNEEIDPIINKDKESTINKYETAALLLKQGRDDNGYIHLITSKKSKWVYKCLHTHILYVIHFVICIILLLLAFFETPSILEKIIHEEKKKNLVIGHSVSEITCLIFLLAIVTARGCWYRSGFIKRRTFIITIFIAVMIVEAITVAARQTNHVRITRILRPVFLLDTYYMTSVRRLARQIIKTLESISDVLLLLIFINILFGLFGYLLFADSDPEYFSSFGKSYLSFFIAASTANFPNIMMKEYAQQRATVLFYFVYLILTLYFISNIMLLAIIYNSFKELDKMKFKKIFTNKCIVLHKAFQLLRKDSNLVIFRDFLLMMQYYQPRMPEWKVLCIFKSLSEKADKNDNTEDNNQQGRTEDEFLRLYDILNLSWNEVDKDGKKVTWFSLKCPPTIQRIPKIFQSKLINYIQRTVMFLVTLANLVTLIVFVSIEKDETMKYEQLQKVLPGTFCFLILYSVDIAFNIVKQGFEFFKKFWNVADLIVIVTSFVSAFVSMHHITWGIVLPFKLLRLFSLKHSHRNIINTMVCIASRLVSVFVLLLLIYYCFAIIGMEFLYGDVKQGCCTNASYDVGDYYEDIIVNNTALSENIFYLNNFDNVLNSYATLFVLMVVNNWYIIMEGFASQVNPKNVWFTRIYFMSFYIITLIVLQVVIALIVDVFQLKIQAVIKSGSCLKHPDDSSCACTYVEERKKKIVIPLTEDNLTYLNEEVSSVDEHNDLHPQNKIIRKWRRCQWRRWWSKRSSGQIRYEGSMRYTNRNIQEVLYKEDIQKWRKSKSKINSNSSPRGKADNIQDGCEDQECLIKELKESLRKYLGKRKEHLRDIIKDFKEALWGPNST